LKPRRYIPDAPPATGVFNLNNWTALQPDGSLVDGIASSQHWIWIEGIPADIKRFENQRVVLLGPPPCVRSWSSTVPFSGMEARLEVIEKLNPQAVQDWLHRLARAARS